MFRIASIYSVPVMSMALTGGFEGSVIAWVDPDLDMA